MNPGQLSIGKNNFNLEEANIYATYSNEEIKYYIEIYPPGEENYLMFNGLDLGELFKPSRLEGVSKDLSNDKDELFEHTVVVDDQERFLEWVNLEFNNWDSKKNTFQISGNGVIDKEENLPKVSFKFDGEFVFTGINLHETTEDEVDMFIEEFLETDPEDLEINFEEGDSGGLSCNILWK